MYADHETVGLLNDPDHLEFIDNKALILPSPDELYLFDESSPKVTITVVCSPDKLSELDLLLTAEVYSLDRWKEVEQKLIKRSTIDLSTVPDKPWSMAGVVRGEGFLQKFTITSGKSSVVKRYVFDVKK